MTKLKENKEIDQILEAIHTSRKKTRESLQTWEGIDLKLELMKNEHDQHSPLRSALLSILDK